MAGFYRSSYTADDRQYWLAVTQFQPTDARKAFPCFDEPRFRTPFTIHLAHSSDQIATSNMPVETISVPDSTIKDRQWTKFKTTPPMATYLVSFMVSDFRNITNKQQKINFWSRKNAVQYGSYVLEQSTKILQQLEDYTSISYKLPKLDIIAVPHFAYGAMENWGMVTFLETRIIGDAEKSAESYKSDITQTISHEIAHMWFGDLVTPAWWDFLWLNEGFATYFQYFATDVIEPTWNLQQLFIINVVQSALLNELYTQRAMTTPVKKTREIKPLFDVISYDKAGSVIRMFEHILSPTTFKSTIRRYLKSGYENHDGTVIPQYLYEALDQQTFQDGTPLPQHITASEILKTWTENIGFPLVTVTRDYKTGRTTIEQITYKSPYTSKPAPDQKWIVPLTYTTKSQKQFSNTRPSLWSFSQTSTGLPIEVPATDWILFNLQHAGYYRVQYDQQNWQLLIDQLKKDPNQIHVLNRAQLLDDSLALAYDGKLSYNITLSLVEYLANEYDLIPWLSAERHLYTLISTYEDTSYLPNTIKDFIRNIMAKPFEKIGFEIKSTDDHFTKVGKPIFLSLACTLGLDGCVTEALKEYEKNKNHLEKIQPDLKKVVYCTALRYSSNPEQVRENIMTEYRNTNIPYDKNAFQESIVC